MLVKGATIIRLACFVEQSARQIERYAYLIGTNLYYKVHQLREAHTQLSLIGIAIVSSRMLK